MPYGGSGHEGASSYGAAPAAGAPYGAPYGPPGGAAYGAPPYDAPGGVPYGVPVYSPFQPKPTEGLAIGAFVTSLVGLFLAFGCYFPILACPVGAVLGHIALRRVAENGTQGRGLALAATIIGWIGTGLLLLAVVLIVAIGATSGFS